MSRQILRSLVFLKRGKVNEALNFPRLNSFLVEPNHFKSLELVQKFNHLKFRAAVRFSQYLQTRKSSTNPEDDKKRKPPVLMKFVPIMRPQFFLTIKNWILAKFIIQPYLDVNFTLKDFNIGAKQALALVSSYLSKGDFQSLQGLVTDDAMNEMKRNYCSLNVKERQDLLVKLSDILFAFPFQIGIIFDDENQKRFAEITVVYHSLNNFEELKAQGKALEEPNKDDIKICNYRFIREYTKGVESDWIINRLGHFKICHFEE